MKKALINFLVALLSFVLLPLFSTANAAQETILNRTLNGGSYTWDDARADLNNNFNDLYLHWNLITITQAVNLDTMETDVTANGVQISELVSLSGLAAHSTTFGIFTGVTIPDGSTAQEAYQALETEVELKQDILTFGIGDGNSVLIDSTTVAVGEYSIFTALGLESWSIAEVKINLSLEEVTNTSDANKPVSDATQTALNLKLDTSAAFDPASPGEIGGTTPGIINATEVITVFSDGDAGAFWAQVNTTLPVAQYGVYPYGVNMYKIEAGVHTLLDTGGSETNSLETTITGNEDTEIFVGDGTDSGNFVVMSGAAAMDNTGVVTLNDLPITTDTVITSTLVIDASISEHDVVIDENVTITFSNVPGAGDRRYIGLWTEQVLGDFTVTIGGVPIVLTASGKDIVVVSFSGTSTINAVVGQADIN